MICHNCGLAMPCTYTSRYCPNCWKRLPPVKLKRTIKRVARRAQTGRRSMKAKRKGLLPEVMKHD